MATGGSASMAAVVIGGTGATGKCLVRTLLQAKVCHCGVARLPLVER